ncbi:unnamed protein product [Hermetia illucens]|uniref:Uncharacterized protein n=1 Tax=Hermetia illucens TaxID=343691 RepID=A0A7R8V1H6_HERIL|nr:cecropin-like peptide 1 [Hermetia illucens]CAD7090883.1 unnamed protein product [Hermetia illucens]
MDFSKLLLIFSILLVAFAGQSESKSWWKKVFKPVERAGQRIRDASIKGLAVAQQGANVLSTIRGGPPVVAPPPQV